MNKFTSIDLFCGCGGFSLGMEQAGFRTLAAIDSNREAIECYKANLEECHNVLQEDLTRFHPEHLHTLLKDECVDVIVGGPPCQGFSTVRQVDGANHGHRIVEDQRRYLYKRFLAFVGYFQPRIFVMENVLGIKSAAGGDFFTRVQSEARALGYRVHGEKIYAWCYGVPQKRVRQLIIGTRGEQPIFAGSLHLKQTHTEDKEELAGYLEPIVTLGEAIGDLPPVAAGEGKEETGYDLGRRNA